MGYFRKNWKQILRRIRFNIIALLIFFVIAVLGLHLLQNRLLQNAQALGVTLARSCSIEEGNNVTVYETLMRIGTQYIDKQLESNPDTEDIQRFLQTFYNNLSETVGSNVIDPYAVVDGKIIAANPWEGDETFDVSQAGWYQQAMEADGEIIFTDAYMDSIYNKPVITIAQKFANFEGVLAFDIFPENFRLTSHSVGMPENSSYYLCDQKGTLLYYQTDLDKGYDEIQEYIETILPGIRTGELYAYDSYVQDFEGNRRGVYYWQMENGWVSIITVPYRTILSGLRQLTWIFSLAFAFFLAVLIFMVWKDYRLNVRVNRDGEILRVLGNSYYSIYRLDYQMKTFEIIKGPEDVHEKIPAQGPYSVLLEKMQEFIEKDAYREFLKSFSIESIQNLVARRIKDFGGDFLRLFGEEYKWVSVRLMFDDSLAEGEVILCFREVDAEKRQQLQQQRLLETALETAKRSEKAKNAFFNNMSHDMRTPLNAIIGMSELVQKNLDDPQKIAGYMEKINFSSKQLLNLINDILEMSRLEQGKISLDYQQFDLKKCVNDCAAPFHAQADKEQKTFTVSFDMEDAIVMGDFFRIGQILNNLLSNAFKYSKAGAQIFLRVKQLNQQEHTKYQIVVQDTGIGMSREFVERIFEPYARETRFGAQKVSGTGLGMPIVKSLVSQMSGQITVDSELGKGSTFTITIPLETVRETEKPEQEETEAASQFSLEGRKILLAEDNDFNMEIATEILSMHGVQVTQAWNGAEAVLLFRESLPFSFDAILMDMQMPEMDGCEAARNIRAMNRPDAQVIPIIAVTANAFAEDIAMTTEAGMNAHISKPIDFEVLCRTLEEWIGKERG
ncbi:MAG TPA: response regulator [Candidatus Merdivicinus intestinigallinarum]|nr:response regulator [Candidatus Merdivicinus intestinigallinarum]